MAESNKLVDLIIKTETLEINRMELSTVWCLVKMELKTLGNLLTRALWEMRVPVTLTKDSWF